MLLSTITVALSLAMYQAPATPSGEDLETTFRELKAAEEKKDVDQIKKLAIDCSTMARAIQKAQPAGGGDSDLKSKMDVAKQVEAYADYALYTAAYNSTDKAKVVELFEALDQVSPKGEYTPKLYGAYVEALEATGKRAKVFPFAEKAIARDPNNEVLLYTLAEGYFTRKNWAQAATYGAKLGASSKRAALAGRGYYWAGYAYANQNKHLQADKALRAALPHLKSETQLYAAALFQLGVSDYNAARATHDKAMMKDAIAYSEECAKINNPMAQQASTNAFTMKKELALFR